MGKNIVDGRGRIVIPKGMRDELNLRSGQQVIIEKREGGILIRPAIDVERLFADLRGCVKKSKIHPQDIKHIWHMRCYNTYRFQHLLMFSSLAE